MHRLRKDILTPQELVSPLTPDLIGSKGLPFSGPRDKPAALQRKCARASLATIALSPIPLPNQPHPKMPSFRKANRRRPVANPRPAPSAVAGTGAPKEPPIPPPASDPRSAPRLSASVPAVCEPATRRALGPLTPAIATPKHDHNRRKSGRGNNPSALPAPTR